MKFQSSSPFSISSKHSSAPDSGAAHAWQAEAPRKPSILIIIAEVLFIAGILLAILALPGIFIKIGGLLMICAIGAWIWLNCHPGKAGIGASDHGSMSQDSANPVDCTSQKASDQPTFQKIRVGLSGKNLPALLMDTGLILVLLSLIIENFTIWKIHWFLQNLTGFPGFLFGLFLVLGLAPVVVLLNLGWIQPETVCSSSSSLPAQRLPKTPESGQFLTSSSTVHLSLVTRLYEKKAFRICLLILELCFLIVWMLVFYASDYYPAHEAGLAAMKSNESVEVKDLKKSGGSVPGTFFDGPGDEDALIFYPGAKVQPAAYAPLMQEIAAEGIDCFLLDMPWNMAVLSPDQASSVMSDGDFLYHNWYIGGHSLGGAMAASFAASHHTAAEPGMPRIKGLALLASYPTEKLPETLKVVSIYGSEDGVLNMKKFGETLNLLPEDVEVICLEGGNHAGFGSYGPQKGDHPATISPEEQWQETSDEIINVFQPIYMQILEEADAEEILADEEISLQDQ